MAAVTFRPAISPKTRRASAEHLGPAFLLEAIDGLSKARQVALLRLGVRLQVVDDEQGAVIGRLLGLTNG